MSRVAFVFASTYGQTRKIVTHLASAAATAGHDTSLVDVTKTPDAPLPEAELIVVASAMYTGQHPNIVRFARAHHAELTAGDAAFVSVSLAAALGTDHAEELVWDYVGTFSDETGWSPNRIAVVAGSVAMDKYDFATKALVRVAAWCRGLDLSRDAEHTDWPALEAETSRWWQGI